MTRLWIGILPHIRSVCFHLSPIANSTSPSPGSRGCGHEMWCSLWEEENVRKGEGGREEEGDTFDWQVSRVQCPGTLGITSFFTPVTVPRNTIRHQRHPINFGHWRCFPPPFRRGHIILTVVVVNVHSKKKLHTHTHLVSLSSALVNFLLDRKFLFFFFKLMIGQVYFLSLKERVTVTYDTDRWIGGQVKKTRVLKKKKKFFFCSGASGKNNINSSFFQTCPLVHLSFPCVMVTLFNL